MKWNLNNLKVIGILLVAETTLRQVWFFPSFLDFSQMMFEATKHWIFLAIFWKYIFYIINSKEICKKLQSIFQKEFYFTRQYFVQPTRKP